MHGLKPAILAFFVLTATSTEAAPFWGVFTQAFNHVAQAVNTHVVANVEKAANEVGKGVVFAANQVGGAAVTAANAVGGVAVTTVNGIDKQVIGGIKDFGITMKNSFEAIPQTVSVVGTSLETAANFVKNDLVLETINLAVTLGQGVAEGFELKEADQQQMTTYYEDINRIWATMDDYVKIYYAANISPQKYEALKAVLTKEHREALIALVAKVRNMSEENRLAYLNEGEKRYKIWVSSDAPAPAKPENNTNSWNAGNDMYMGN